MERSSLLLKVNFIAFETFNSSSFSASFSVDSISALNGSLGHGTPNEWLSGENVEMSSGEIFDADGNLNSSRLSLLSHSVGSHFSFRFVGKRSYAFYFDTTPA